MQTQFITPDDRDWQRCLERLPHDIYHKAEYVRLCANHDGGEPVAFAAAEGESLFFVPLLLCPVPAVSEAVDGLCDAISPYGYPCPLSTSSDEDFVRRAVQHMLSGLRQRGVVSTFLRLHPLFPAPLQAFRRHGTVIQHGETVFFDLTQSDDELRQEMRRTTRQQIDRTRRNGFVCEVDPQWRYLDEFMEAYWETMRRAAAKDEYLFPPEYFYELKDALHDSIHLFVVHIDGQFACGGVNSEVGGVVQAHLAGSRSEFVKDQPLKLMLDTVRHWAKQRGNRVFHLGGGLGGENDSLFKFKAAFAKGRADFCTWRGIVNADAYQMLVSRWEHPSGIKADGVDGFFPAYRKALPENGQPKGPPPSRREQGTRRDASSEKANIQSQFVSPDSDIWRECLTQMRHDVYHMPRYVQLCAEQAQGKPLAFVVQDGKNVLFVPLIVRPIVLDDQTNQQLYDATSPYGYPSPLITLADNGEPSPAFLEKALGLALTALKERGIISLFLRLHPLMPLPLDVLRQFGMAVHHGETVYADLTLSEDELWRQTRRQHRRRINRARRIGFTAIIDHDWRHFEEFFEIYTETMVRVDAAEHFFFPREYFHRLREALDGNLHLCLVSINGSAAAATLFTEVCGIVQLHLGGSREKYQKEAPTIFMDDFIRSWAKKRGNRTLHFGGGVGAKSDSLFAYKAGFSELRSHFYTWRAIINVDQYQELARQWVCRAGIDADGTSGFFPAYRKALPEPSHLTEASEPISQA